MKRTNLNYVRMDILSLAKKHIVLGGWNDNIFLSVSKYSKYKEEEIRALFPKGYKSLLELYLLNSDQEMTKAFNKMDLMKIKTHERIKQIILLRLKINEKDKILVKRTLFTLMLPQHASLAILSLYNTADEIWFLAGDNSTDFNFYSKRAILMGIYSSTLIYWVNNNKTIKNTKTFLDKQLNSISKIPKMKQRVKSLVDIAPKIFSFAKNFSMPRQ